MREIENNKVKLTGWIISDFVFSHETFGERFYIVEVSIERKSGTRDILPITVSERLIGKENNFSLWDKVNIFGTYRSYNSNDGEKNRLVLTVFSDEFSIAEEYQEDRNDIFLDGYICKPPAYRKTQSGREITDLIIAVSRPYRKTDHIPCICWSRNARYASSLEVGTRLQIEGRIQSREYQKKISEKEFEKRTAYEVSISKMEEVRNEKSNAQKINLAEFR